MAMPITHFIAFEILGFIWMFVRFRLVAAVWRWAFVAVLSVEVVVDVAMKILRTVKPRTSSDEDAAYKPLGTVIAVGSASIGGIVIGQYSDELRPLSDSVACAT